VSFLTTHRRKLSFPIKGTLAPPLPGCQTRLRVVPDVGSQRIELPSRYNKILCHSKQPMKRFRETETNVSPQRLRAPLEVD
jgi:hypothetical protein